MKLYYNEADILQKICLTEGIWCVHKIPRGTEYTWISEKIEELPDKMTSLSFLQHKYKIASKINKRLMDAEKNEEIGIKDKIRTDDIMNIIESVLGGK